MSPTTKPITPGIEPMSIDKYASFDQAGPLVFDFESAAQSEPVAQRFGFQASVLSLLAPEDINTEVHLSPSVSNLPLSEDWLLGLMNLRGNLVPVFDLNTLLGFEPDPDCAMVLTLGLGRERLGLTIRSIPHAIDFSNATKVNASLPPELAPFLTDAFEVDGESWFDINWPHLFESRALEAAAH